MEALFTADREEEWTEFLADCGKFDAEIDKEIRNRNSPWPSWRKRNKAWSGYAAGTAISRPRCVRRPVGRRGRATAEALRRAAGRLDYTDRVSKPCTRCDAMTVVTGPELPGVLGSLAPLLDRDGYLVIGGLILVEDFGVPAPGETVLIAGAVYAGARQLNIVAVVAIAIRAAASRDANRLRSNRSRPLARAVAQPPRRSRWPQWHRPACGGQQRAGLGLGPQRPGRTTAAGLQTRRATLRQCGLGAG
jgi:hypothetical protein